MFVGAVEVPRASAFEGSVTELSSYSLAPAHGRNKEPFHIQWSIYERIFLFLKFTLFNASHFQLLSFWMSESLKRRLYQTVWVSSPGLGKLWADSMNFKCSCNAEQNVTTIFSVLCSASLLYSSRLEKLPSLCLSVMEIGNHWKAVMFSSTATTT